MIKKFMEVQRNMSNAFGIILFYKVVGWFDGQDIVWNEEDQGSIPFTNIYYMWSMHICIYTLYNMCVNV
jgi:hypothetical protein